MSAPASQPAAASASPATAHERAVALLDALEQGTAAIGAMPALPAWRELAWALKDECLAAWTADPPRTRACADVLARMHAARADSEVGALALWAGGIAALAAGHLEDSLRLLEQAQDVLAQVGRARAAAETLVAKIMALAMLGRHADALSCGEQARALFIRHGDGHGAGRVELNLGTLLFRLDRHAEAARMYRGAAVNFARARDDARSILADIGLAHALTWQFDFDEALRINERALRRAERRGLRVPQAQARLAIGRIELLRGRYQRALAQLSRALALMDDAGAAPQQRLEAGGALADAYLAVNLLPEAQRLYDEVVAAAVALQAPTEEARARVERARVHGRLGHQEAALADLTRSLALFHEAGNAAAAADVELAAGQLRLAAGDAARAAAHARSAAAALEGSGVRGWQLDALNLEAAAAMQLGDLAAAQAHFDTAWTGAHALALLPQQVAARVGQGQIALAAGRDAQAVTAFAQALELVEVARAELGDDEFRSALAALGERAHRLLVRGTAGLLDAGEVGAAALFEAVERGRSRALTQALAEAHVEDSEEDAREQFLRQRWRDLISAGAEGGPGPHAAELRRLENEWLEVHRRRRLRRAEASRPGPGAAMGNGWASAAAVQRELGDGSALVAFHLDGDDLTACVVRPRSVLCLGWRVPELAEAVEGLRFQIETPRHQAHTGDLLYAHAPRLMERVRSRAMSLHAKLWAPLLPVLLGVNRVVVVPHGVLHYVPWCALHDGQQWLVEALEVTLAASAGAWLTGGRQAWRAPQRVLALGATDSLPHVRAELETLERLLGARADIRLGDDARAQALQDAQADIVHLACHAQFRADNPAFSLLALAGGPLTLHEMRALRMRCALVVLSACETGLSRVAAGDELIGLVRGFTLAGARAVLATQWAVSDASMAQHVADLYRQLADGVAPAAALRAAQRAAIAKGAHPFHWAALTLYGRG